MYALSFRNITIFAASESSVWSQNGGITMKSIESAISPLIFVLCLCRLCVFEYPQSRPRLYLTIFYILTSWLLYIYIVMRTKMFIEKFTITLPPIAYFSTVAASIFMLLNMCYHKVTIYIISNNFIIRKNIWIFLWTNLFFATLSQ